MNEQLFNKLKSASDVTPEKHDGSYELVQKTVEAYASMDSLNSIDYKDLDLIYFMSVGSWKKHGISFDKKRSAINGSHIDDKKKAELNELLNVVINKARNKYYENTDENEPSTGMFAASFQTIFGAANDKNEYLSKPDNLTLWNQQIREFIAMLIDISRMNDDEEIFKRAESIFNNGIRGLQAGTASQILHCLKPNTFPILNNVGRDGYRELGLKLVEPEDKLAQYNKNCQIIKRFRDDNFTFKNYRTFDKEFFGLGDSKSDNKGQFDNQERAGDEEEWGDKTVEQKNGLPKNLILYGPPGTGKTYNTVRKAVEIIEGEDWKNKDYKAVKEKYDQLLNEGRINFVTFHQSYGYEEFVQGIKPVVDENGDIAYEVQDGVFKEFCEKAKGPSLEEAKDYGLNKNPTIWKVSLEGTGDNRTRTYCFDNGCIRVGFDSYGENIVDDTDFKDGGKNVLTAFINDMRIGDIVLSCYTNTTIDGVGVLTGDYEWHNEFDRYKRLRKVEWIYKGKKNIVEINGNKTMTLSTVYRLNNITLADVIKIVEGADNEIKNTSVKISSQRSKYVFIIDEINRGNISKIFGELITLIEDSKRECANEAMKVTLPYKKDGTVVEFSVPDNVYIIGTMNTADRSIAVIDTALRRRFTFIEMMPDYAALKNTDGSPIEVDGINIAEMLKTMNERIAVLYDREHTIGHAYFMPLKDGGTLEKLADIFKTKIIPLLQEYFYDDYEKIRLVLGDNQKKDERQFVSKKEVNNTQLFGEGVDELLSDNRYTYSINDVVFGRLEAYRFIYESDRTSVKVEE